MNKFEKDIIRRILTSGSLEERKRRSVNGKTKGIEFDDVKANDLASHVLGMKFPGLSVERRREVSWGRFGIAMDSKFDIVRGVEDEGGEISELV